MKIPLLYFTRYVFGAVNIQVGREMVVDRNMWREKIVADLTYVG